MIGRRDIKPDPAFCKTMQERTGLPSKLGMCAKFPWPNEDGDFWGLTPTTIQRASRRALSIATPSMRIHDVVAVKGLPGPRFPITAVFSVRYGGEFSLCHLLPTHPKTGSKAV